MRCACYPGIMRDCDPPMWTFLSILLFTTNLCWAETYTNNNNGLVTLPPDIPLDTTVINLDNNAFELLPALAFYNLSDLLEVSMRNNLLTAIDAMAFQGTDINDLDFANNKLKSIPECTLSTLTRIVLTSNEIYSINFDSLNSLYPNLAGLTLGDNPISDENITGIPNIPLTELFIQLTNIQNISWIRHFQGSLRRLTINNLNISSMDSDIFSNYSQLIHLLASNCELTSISCPEGTAIWRLVIGGNQFTQLPDLGCLKYSLVDLGYFKNGLTSIPGDYVTDYNQLTALNLANNLLSTFQCSAINGTSMSELDLGENQFTSIPNLECVAPTLRNLGLSYNLISIVHTIDVDYLTNLTTLKLSGNLLQCLEEVR